MVAATARFADLVGVVERAAQIDPAQRRLPGAEPAGSPLEGVDRLVQVRSAFRDVAQLEVDQTGVLNV